jgi:heterotetrameric sarcosine oxidase gamma subunit
MPHLFLTACTPFADLFNPPMTGDRRGLIIAERSGIAIAMMMQRRGAASALADRMHQQLGLQLPQGPFRVEAGDVALSGIGVGKWLATGHQRAGDLASWLRESVGDLASVVDQSDAYGLLQLSGARARDTLCKLVRIDLHPAEFDVGCVAATVAGHVGTILWRLDDQDDGSPVFEVAVARSLAGSFWHALAGSAAEFGVTVSGSVRS